MSAGELLDGNLHVADQSGPVLLLFVLWLAIEIHADCLDFREHSEKTKNSFFAAKFMTINWNFANWTQNRISSSLNSFFSDSKFRLSFHK